MTVAARRWVVHRLAAAAIAASLFGGCSALTPTPPATVPPTPAEPSATPSPDPWAELEDFAPGLRPAGTPVDTSSGEPAGAKTITIELGAGDDPPGSFRRTSVGLSFEASDLADPRWEPGSSSLETLVKALRKPSLRFGGNSVDRRVWWTSRGEPAPEWAEVTIGPDDMARLGRFADATDATVTMALPLGHFDPDRAADMAKYARRALGERLVAVAIGNEPNGFRLESQPQYRIRGRGWSPEKWVDEARKYEQAIHNQVPDLPLAGPGAYDARWLRAFADAELTNTRALTQHWYPLWSCPGRRGDTDADAAPSVDNLASPDLPDRTSSTLGVGAEIARDNDLPFWIEEIGPTSCPGTGETSRTGAQALWTVEIALQAAGLGADRLNLHSSLASCRGGPPMSAVCGADGSVDNDPRVVGRSNYLALLFAGQVRAGELVPVRVSGSERVRAYATRSRSGVDVVVIAMDESSARYAVRWRGDKNLKVSQISRLDSGGLAARDTARLTLLGPTRDSPTRLSGGTATLIRFDVMD